MHWYSVIEKPNTVTILTFYYENPDVFKIAIN